MTILVTGATGNVGRPLVEQLLAAGHPVRALTRNPGRADLPAGAQVVAGDLADTAAAAAAFEGVSAAHRSADRRLHGAADGGAGHGTAGEDVRAVGTGARGRFRRPVTALPEVR